MSFVVPSFSLEFNLKCSFDPIFQDYHIETRHKVEAFGIEKTKKVSFKCWEESGPEPSCGHKHKSKAVRGYHLYKHVWKPAIG